MAERRAAIADMRKHEVALRKAVGAGGHTSEKPESVTLPGFPWRSEGGYAEISHVKENIIGYRCRVNDRPAQRVLTPCPPLRSGEGGRREFPLSRRERGPGGEDRAGDPGMRS